MLAVVENIIDGRVNAQYHDREGSARQETSPTLPGRRWEPSHQCDREQLPCETP